MCCSDHHFHLYNVLEMLLWCSHTSIWVHGFLKKKLCILVVFVFSSILLFSEISRNSALALFQSLNFWKFTDLVQMCPVFESLFLFNSSCSIYFCRHYVHSLTICLTNSYILNKSSLWIAVNILTCKIYCWLPSFETVKGIIADMKIYRKFLKIHLFYILSRRYFFHFWRILVKF